MSRKSNRKKRQRTKRRAATHQPPSVVASSPFEELLDAARSQPDRHLALRMFREIAEQSQRKVAVSVFDGGGESLWDNPDARCYFQASFGAAVMLWHLNRTVEAATQFEEVLQADSADHQFARYWLAACWLTTGEFDKTNSLLGRYDEATGFWRYAQALGAFASGGDSDRSQHLLRQARELNGHVVNYVLGEEVVYGDRPIEFELGRQSTHSTARLLLPAWRSVPGSVTWMRRVLRVPLARPDREFPFPHQQMLELPVQEGGRWQVGLHEMPRENPADEPCWLLGVADVGHEELRRMTVIEGEPSPVAVWRAVLAAFLQPLDGQAARPERLDVPRPEFRRAWQSMLEDIGVDCHVKYRPQPVLQLLEAMSDVVAAQALPKLDETFDPRCVPLSDATWQIDFFHETAIISNEQVGAERPWSVLIIDKASEEVVCLELVKDGPDPEQLWEHALRSMQSRASRPRRIELADADAYDFLRPKLTGAGIECVIHDELAELHGLCRAMAAGGNESEMASLADGDGVTNDEMESFYYAAAAYFRQAPWRHVEGEIPIEMEVAGLGRRYGIVLGRTGVSLGLAVHENWQDAVDMINGRTSWAALSGFAVIFDEESVLAPEDLYLVERYGWPIASAEGYPAVLCFRPGHQHGSPSADELEFLTCCLHCVPEFVKSDLGEQTYPKSANGPSRRTRLSWDHDDDNADDGVDDDVVKSMGVMWDSWSSTPRGFGVSMAARGGPRRPSAFISQDPVVDAIQHINRKGKTYYLHHTTNKNGTPKYFCSRSSEGGDLCRAVPDGFEIYENARGQVFCRRIKPRLITDAEVELVQGAIRQYGKQALAFVEAKKRDLIVYEDEHPVFKFSLMDAETRTFCVSRWCFRGSIDDWHDLCDFDAPLGHLAKKYCRHIGEESFFDLM